MSLTQALINLYARPKILYKRSLFRKNAQFGAGFALAQEKGPACHDAVLVSPVAGFTRAFNYAGGLEDGLTSGEQLIVTVAVAPPASAGAPKETVNLDTLQLDYAANPAGIFRLDSAAARRRRSAFCPFAGAEARTYLCFRRLEPRPFAVVRAEGVPRRRGFFRRRGCFFAESQRKHNTICRK